MSYYQPPEPDTGARLGFWAWMLAPAAVVILSLIVRGCST